MMVTVIQIPACFRVIAQKKYDDNTTNTTTDND